MKPKQKFRSKFEKGFTLIELLVVVSVIGFLSSVLLVSTRKASISASDNRKVENSSVLKQALDLYYQDYNAVPSATAHLIGGGSMYYTSDADPEWTSQLGNGLRSYISSLPTHGASHSNFYLDGGAPEYSSTYPGASNYLYFIVNTKFVLTIYKKSGALDHYVCMKPGSYMVLSYLDQLSKYQNTAFIGSNLAYYDYVVYGGNVIDPIAIPAACT